jgi:hypothetical protein
MVILFFNNTLQRLRNFAMFKYFFSIVPCALLLAGCNNNETGPKRYVDPEAIFFDYRVWGDEENDEITVRLQYFAGFEGGKTISWDQPAGVEFDGEILAADSSKMNGFYYETRIPLENFTGKHRIVFTDSNKRQYSEEFEFFPFSLSAQIPAVIRRKEFPITLNGLDSGATVRLLLIDTAFYSRGIDRIDTLRNDSLIITPRDFENLRNGPVYLEIHKDEERPLQEPGKAGGRLSMSYSLKRVFELKD